jgi:hypothetical protein
VHREGEAVPNSTGVGVMSVRERVAIGGVCAGEVTGGDERDDGRGPCARGRAVRESGVVVADGWGRSVSHNLLPMIG